MGKPNVNVLEGVKLSTGQPNSNEEVEVGDKVWKSSGQPSSPKNKVSLNNQLLLGKPKLTEKTKDEKKKKRSLGEPNTLKKKYNTSADQTRQAQPRFTEEVEIRRNKNNTTGQPNVNMFERGKLSTAQPNSNKEVEVGEKVWRSSGQPSSPKEKNILVDQLTMGVPKSIDKFKDEKNKKRSLGEPNTLQKSMYLQIS